MKRGMLVISFGEPQHFIPSSFGANDWRPVAAGSRRPAIHDIAAT